MIGKAIYALLQAATDVTDIVGTQVFPDMATQQAVYPFIVYTIDSVTPTDTKEGASKLDVVTVAVMSYANSYTTAQDLAGKVRIALDAKKGTFGGVEVGSIRFTNAQAAAMDTDKRVYIVEQKYNVRECR
jgi:hypothetical protein